MKIDIYYYIIFINMILITYIYGININGYITYDNNVNVCVQKCENNTYNYQ